MAEEQSKSASAKKRAAKKERDAAFEAGAAAAAPPAPVAPAAAKASPKPKAKAAATPEPAPKQAAKAKPKAAPKAEPAPPVPEPKSKAKAKAKATAATPEPAPKQAAKAKAEPKAQPAPPAPEPKQAAKPKAQPKSKAKAAPEPEEPKQQKTEVIQPFEIDDGFSGGWEQSTGLSKKMEKKLQKAQEMLAEVKTVGGKAVPGLAPAGQIIPGMGPTKVDQKGINAILASAAAKGAEARAAVEAESAAAKAKESNLSSATVKVPENKIGIVIGPKGSKIKLIQEKTGVTRIDTSGEVFTITGPPQAVAQAEAAIKELIEKGYCSMLFEDFKEEAANVHPSSFPDLIGKGGCVIKAFKSELDVEVKIPEVPKNSPAGKKFKVTFAGKNENVQKAMEVVNSISMYGYHPLTHPDQGHVEMEVPEWSYRYLIGKAGSELRHIQNNYKVKVNIPREHSACQSVVVVGLPSDVERAKTYIEKVLWNAENQTKGREKQEGAVDPWGAEEPEEDWMKSYMYKR